MRRVHAVSRAGNNLAIQLILEDWIRGPNPVHDMEAVAAEFLAARDGREPG